MTSPDDPEQWIAGTEIDEASTITVCTGLTADEVLRAYGASAEPETLDTVVNGFTIDPWVAVHDLGDGAVLAFEDNGWQGSRAPQLRRSSAAGRAASVFWNVNGVREVAFAESGAVLSSTTDYAWNPICVNAPPVAEAVSGLDLSDWQRQRERALVAVGRFTGRHVGLDDVRAVIAADRAHRILPWLDDHHPSGAGDDVASRRAVVEARLGAEFAGLGAVPDAELRELVWTLAERVCRETGLTDDESAARSSLQQRRMTEEAELLARAAWLEPNVHLAGWDTVHNATNPEPLSALLWMWSRTRLVLGASGVELLHSYATGR